MCLRQDLHHGFLSKIISMRSYSLFTLLLFTLPFSAQDPLTVEFQEATPLWSHAAVDTTFSDIAGNPFWTKYSSLAAQDIRRDGDFLYLFSSSGELTGGFPDRHGFVLDKLRIESGDVLWSHHNTINNSGIQDYYHKVNVRSDGHISLTGVEQFGGGDSPFNWSLGGYNSNTIRKVINATDGSLLETVSASDSLHLSNFPSIHYQHFEIDEDSLFLTAKMVGTNVGTISNPVYDYGISYQLRDRDLTIIDEERLVFDLGELGPFSIEQPSFMVETDDNMLVALAIKDRLDSWENQGFQLLWTDISDPSNIQTTRIIDYRDLVPNSKESFLNLRFRSYSNTIFVSHTYPNFVIQEHSAYILWLDSDGAVKTFIDLPYYNNHLYQFTDMFFANDDFAYLFAFPSSTGRSGFDIIKIQNGVDSVQFINSLTTIDPTISYGTQVNAVIDGNYLIVAGLNQKEGEGSRTSTTYHCFDAKELGLDFVTSTENLPNDPQEITIYPNPANSFVEINCNTCSLGSELHIVNILGQPITKLSGFHNHVTLDISNFEAGIYNLLIFDHQMQQIQSSPFIKIN